MMKPISQMTENIRWRHRTARGFLAAAALILFLAVILAGCRGGNNREKPFPGGDPGKQQELHRLPEEIAAPVVEENRRSILKFPAGSYKKNGLVLTAAPEESAVRAGNPMIVNVILRNQSSNAVLVNYPSTRRFDIIVFSDPKQTEIVYRWSRDKVFAQLYQEVKIDPRDKLTRKMEIPTTDSRLEVEMETDENPPLLPGTYWFLTIHEGEPFLATPLQEFQVWEN